MISSLKFSKYSGAGNTFLIIDQKDWLAVDSARSLVPQMCDANLGLSADGVLVLHPSADADFKWEFYNSDGSTAEMCGNLARCATLYAFEKSGKTEFKFETTAGIVLGKKSGDDLFTIEMTQITNRDQFIEDSPVYDSGVPHLIKYLQKIPELETIRSEAQRLRRHSALGLSGANVTYMEEVDDSSIRAVTFERGVEDFTLACGTGAVAAAYHQSLRSMKKLIEVQMPGGKLVVDFQNAKPKLSGPACKVASGEWIIR